MTLKQIGNNQTQIIRGNLAILYSYNTPVAAVDKDNGTGLAFYTEKKWSATTTRHINNWLSTKSFSGVGTKPQEFFDNLVA